MSIEQCDLPLLCAGETELGTICGSFAITSSPVARWAQLSWYAIGDPRDTEDNDRWLARTVATLPR